MNRQIAKVLRNDSHKKNSDGSIILAGSLIIINHMHGDSHRNKIHTTTDISFHPNDIYILKDNEIPNLKGQKFRVVKCEGKMTLQEPNTGLQAAFSQGDIIESIHEELFDNGTHNYINFVPSGFQQHNGCSVSILEFVDKPNIQKHKCNCSIIILMGKGCVCGGK